MKVRQSTVLVLLLIAQFGAEDPGCINECHSGPFGYSCSLQVATFTETDQYPMPTYIPSCKPCTVVCQERENGYIGGYTWNLFSVSDHIDYTLDSKA